MVSSDIEDIKVISTIPNLILVLTIRQMQHQYLTFALLIFLLNFQRINISVATYNAEITVGIIFRLRKLSVDLFQNIFNVLEIVDLS